jgi:hypothetical protein
MATRFGIAVSPARSIPFAPRYLPGARTAPVAAAVAGPDAFRSLPFLAAPRSCEDVEQRVVSFTALVTVNWLVRFRERDFSAPGPLEGGGIVDVNRYRMVSVPEIVDARPLRCHQSRTPD